MGKKQRMLYKQEIEIKMYDTFLYMCSELSVSLILLYM